MNPDHQIIIRFAEASEHVRLREIMIASRGVWGYDPVRFRQWAASLDVSPEGLGGAETYVAEQGAHLVGWAALAPSGDGVFDLAELWVEPDWIGKGIGSKLFRFALGRARDLGARRLEWGAEPGAVGFYVKMGGQHVRATKSSSFDFIIPVMGIDL